jgi:formylglycine-generating enzyme required for sulfatase activity
MHDNYEGAPNDGSPWLSGNQNTTKYTTKVARGGSWYSYPRRCRSANRFFYDSDETDFYIIGFRLVSFPPRTLE